MQMKQELMGGGQQEEKYEAALDSCRSGEVICEQNKGKKARCGFEPHYML
jgi:hypothetical protein